MATYKPIVRTKADFVYDDTLGLDVHLPHLVVHEDDDGVPTGILDKQGNELARYTKVPMGFCRSSDG